MSRHVRRLDHVSLRVVDLARSLAFYVDLLGIAVRDRGILDGDGSAALTQQDRVAFADLDLGDGQTLELLQLATDEAPEPAGRPFPGRAHISFVTHDARAAHAALVAAGAPASGTPSRIAGPGFWGGSVVFYARDPDGHTVELIERPPGEPA